MRPQRGPRPPPPRSGIDGVTQGVPPPVETGNEPIPRWIAGVSAAVLLVGVIALGGSLEGTNPDLVGPGPSEPAPPSAPPSGRAAAVRRTTALGRASPL